MRRVGAGVFLGTALLVTSPASAAVSHVVQPGETLWSISAANNLTTETVAAYNGISADAQVVLGETIEVPTVEEGAAALGAAGTTTASASTATTTSAAPAAPAPTSSAPGMSSIDSPWGPLPLDPAAAESWNAMDAVAQSQYGVDLSPGGPLSAYRTYEQQAYLYDQFLAGTGSPANPPGSSSHELGVAVDLATQEMRSVIDAIGAQYGWSATIPSEWWHVQWCCY